MAFRRPLYYNGSGQLQEMTDTMINNIRSQMFWEFIANPSVYLSVYSSGGNLGNITDTRMQAGAYKTGVSDYPAESSTDEPSIVTVNYSRFNQSIAASNTVDVNALRYPAYFDGGNQIRAMNIQDFIDTFATTAASWLAGSNEMYYVSTSTSVSGYSLVSWDPVYTDTRADTGAYTASGIEETLDQPTTINNFYLHKRNNSGTSYTTPICIDTNGNLYSVDAGSFNGTLSETIRYVCAYYPGYRLRFGINYGSNINGTGMTDTRLDGAGLYEQRFVGGDDYRAQEFPNGTAQTVATYYLYSRIE